MRPESDLQRLNVRGLQALRAADDFELDRLAVVQALVAIRENRGEVDENVLSGLALDESKALAGVKPLHCSLFFQLCFSFLFELFGAVSHRLQAKKEGCKCGLAAPSTILKVLQEQQTQGQYRTFVRPLSRQFAVGPLGFRSSEFPRIVGRSRRSGAL